MALARVASPVATISCASNRHISRASSAAAPTAVGGCRRSSRQAFSSQRHAEQRLRLRAIAEDVEQGSDDNNQVYDRATMTDEQVKAYIQELQEYFDSLLQTETYSFEYGDKVVGQIFRVEERGAWIDIGDKGPAFLPGDEISLSGVRRATRVLAPGTSREFEIIGFDQRDMAVVSLKQSEMKTAWQRVRQMQEEDATVTGTVVAANTGGLVVDVEHLTGFLPASHLHPSLASDLPALEGQTIDLKFLEVDEERERLVFSNRRAGAEVDLQGYKVGNVVLGTVQAVKPYGAFIDLGNGINGLLHISQISHDRIASVEAVLSEGDKLKVMILSQDKERGRVSLSTKKLEPTPGDMLRDPALVFERADEMAASFRERVASAEAAALEQQSEEGAELAPKGDEEVDQAVKED